LNVLVAAAKERGYYVDASDAAEALSQRSMFNIIDADSGYKLEWSREGASERQFLDALAVARTQGEDLDVGYLSRWAQELGLTLELERLLAEARRHEEP
jgi:hypothetical protein